MFDNSNRSYFSCYIHHQHDQPEQHFHSASSSHILHFHSAPRQSTTNPQVHNVGLSQPNAAQSCVSCIDLCKRVAQHNTTYLTQLNAVHLISDRLVKVWHWHSMTTFSIFPMFALLLLHCSRLGCVISGGAGWCNLQLTRHKSPLASSS